MYYLKIPWILTGWRIRLKSTLIRHPEINFKPYLVLSVQSSQTLQLEPVWDVQKPVW